MTVRCIGAPSLSGLARLSQLSALRHLRRGTTREGACNPWRARTARAAAPLRRTSTGSQVERLLEPLLVSGEARIEIVARQLGCSRQTLYRRLKAEGFTFEHVLDGVRRRVSLQLVREGVPIKEIAFRVGFSEPSAFSRAFKRWTGFSPGKF